jgi:hypothetical protein
MDHNQRGVPVGLGCVIAVCTAVLLFVHRESTASMDFIERHLVFSPDGGDGSFDVMLLVVLATLSVAGAFRLALK